MPTVEELSAIINKGNVEQPVVEREKPSEAEPETETPELEDEPEIEVETPETPEAEEEPEAAPTPVIDYTAIASEVSKGKYKSREELEEAIERADRLQEVEQELEEYRTQEPLDPEVLALSAFKKAGGTKKQFDIIYGVELDKLSPLEKIKMQTLLEDPSTDLGELNAFLTSEYKLDEEGGYTELETKAAQFKLKQHATQAGKYLAELQTGITNLPQPKTKAAQEDSAIQWKPEVDNVVKELTKLTQGKGETAFDIPVTAEDRAKLEQYLTKTLKKVPFNDKNKAALKAESERYLRGIKLDEIVEKAQEKARSIAELKNIKETNNPSALHRTEKNIVTKKVVKSDDDRMLAYMKSQAFN